ncbi:MAG: HAMP domain-containing histidine kinase [Planctomycetes bacterium]|nr:HAMP domain-containing histidine kinase [Planctomycetota bacterium]
MLVSGAALAIALVLQLWRSLAVDAETRQWEFEKATIAAERILQRALTSRAVFDRAPGESLLFEGEVIQVDAAVGWLDPVPAAAEEDVVVRHRLDRAALAEFGGGVSGDVVRREYEELLAGALPATPRMQVLAAAAFHARRAGAIEREQECRAELWQRVAALRAEDLGREAVAMTVAAAVRLADPAAPPEWLPRLVALLPDRIAAGLPAHVDLAAQHEASRRRRQLREARAVWLAAAARADVGMLPGPDRHVLWWLPHRAAGADRIGGHDARWLPIEDWLGVVREVGGGDELAEWPWLVEPAMGEVAVTAMGIPFVAGLVPSREPAAIQRRWLLPATTLALLVAFGLTVAQSLRATRREAAAVRAQAEFLTTVTHELKTPLASIRLLGEMLVEGRAAGREREYYRMLAGEAGRLSMLIENVLDLGRLERGERAYDLRTADVAAITAATVSLVEPLLQQGGSGITIRRQAGCELMARVDRAALAQALISVFDNARKYGKGPVEVGLSCADEIILIEVRDRGPGVPAADRERIFARFTRGAAHAHGSVPGVGIGLYLARTIARRLGGDLTCDPPADGGVGARFTFALPAVAATVTTAATAAEAAASVQEAKP